MRKKLYAALVSLTAALACAGPAEASAKHDGHQHQVQRHDAQRKRERARAARRQARARVRARRRAVAYVCPMHPDVRERSRGTCPKCLMDLVAEPRAAKAGGM